MSLPYSHRFEDVLGLTGTSAGFTCPAGFRAVLKCATLYCNAVLNGLIYLHGPLGNAIVAANHDALNATYMVFEGMYVFEEGETIHFASDGQAWDVSSSGYLLTL